MWKHERRAASAAGLILAAALPLAAAGQTITLDNNVAGDGQLIVNPDAYGAVTNWTWPENVDLYDPEGPVGSSNVSFAASSWLYADFIDRVVFAEPGRNLDVQYNVAGATMQYQLDAGLVGSDRDGDGVTDTAMSAFSANGGFSGLDLSFELEQWVEKPAAGSSVATYHLVYTITNNGADTANFLFNRHLDLDLFLLDAIAEDVSGSSDAAGAINPYMRDPGDDAADPVSAVALSGTPGYVYVAAKSGMQAGGPAMAFGTDFQIWDNFGLPVEWQDFTAGVGYAPAVGEVPGAQPAGSVSPFDAFMALEWEVEIPAGGMTQVEIATTYGSRSPVDGDCYADCDGSGGLDFFDFLCFQNAFAMGCP